MKKSIVFTSLAALIFGMSGEALAHPVTPGTSGGSGSGIKVGLKNFNCVAGDVKDENDKVVPPNGANSGQFRTGFGIGMDIITATWLSGDMDVTALEEFVAKSLFITTTLMGQGIQNLDPENPLDQALGCRFIGTVQGATYAVARVINQVQTNCASDGDYWSAYSAGLFCEFSQMSSGISVRVGPTNHSPSLCGIAFEQSCEAAFEGYARAYTSPNVNDCGQWVEKDANVFGEQRHNMCIYSENR